MYPETLFLVLVTVTVVCGNLFWSIKVSGNIFIYYKLQLSDKPEVTECNKEETQHVRVRWSGREGRGQQEGPSPPWARTKVRGCEGWSLIYLLSRTTRLYFVTQIGDWSDSKNKIHFLDCAGACWPLHRPGLLHCPGSQGFSDAGEPARD